MDVALESGRREKGHSNGNKYSCYTHMRLDAHIVHRTLDASP